MPLQTDWEAATWLYSSIGEAYFDKGNYQRAKKYFFDALNCPDGVSNPFIHYMLGKTLVRLNDENGISSLLKAYLLDGETIFELDEEGAVHLNFLQERRLI
ncbi:tetratricopeptide repeat protein [Vreelandella sp. GE22]